MGRADRVIQFIENLTITSGADAGKPFILREWQKAIIHQIYDPVTSDGKRIARQALITMGRKNGKTQLAAALVLCHLFGPESEQRGQVYSAAADRAQASLVFAECAAMIRADPELDRICNIIESTKRIVHFASGSFYSALSSDSKTKHGFSASFLVYDELGQAPNRELYDVLTTSVGARAEPLTVIISTVASSPTHIMSELVDYGRKIQEGTIRDPAFIPFIYEVPADADPWDEANWYAANPALGDFRSLDEMRAYAATAKRIPAREATFRSLYLNQPVAAEARFVSSVDWTDCQGEIDPAALRGKRCWAGLDLSSTTDLTALVLYFPDDAGAVVPFFWVPAAQLEDRERRDRVPYLTWERQGLLEATLGRAVDRLAIAHRLAQISADYDLQGVAFDRWRIEDLRALLAREGIDLPLVEFGQGFASMGPAVDALETAILDRKLQHDGNPLLRWCVSNAVVRIDPAGLRKIDKSRSAERVDGVVALAMAVGLYSRQNQHVDYDFSNLLAI